ncbi:MAG: GtrA family protein [Alphaproteobacteria bacterium]|nr:GtrA family protein [Alphaproteobacteria bacterium]
MAARFTRRLEQHLVRYLAVGLGNTALGLAVIYGCKWALGWPDIAANLAGYAVGLVVSYVLNARWTFRYAGSWWRGFTRFLAVVALAYVANLVTVLALIGFGWNSYLAQAAGILPYTAVGFLGNRLALGRRPLPRP